MQTQLDGREQMFLEVVCDLGLACLKVLDHGFDIVCRLFGLLLELRVHDLSSVQQHLDVLALVAEGRAALIEERLECRMTIGSVA